MLEFNYNQESPNTNNIRGWHQMFQETKSLCKGKSSGNSRVSTESVKRIHRTKPTEIDVQRELQMPQKTVWRIFRRRLKMAPYVVQLVQQLKPKETARSKRTNNAMFMLESMEDKTMAGRLIFSDEPTFYVSGYS
ncbi:DUF4817 domain-containing protein [Trichonephila inaurata madagascariensis]|uniref:DUF4817 domain-containing protein n=1 Tax=Trichonephila inaurata madagascariensis TaxID=2747483 RepID=A0A8X6IJW3_9ARAC|nr:DUF4817 domain-containing protein [Trichonephila inaurata madagascariensis]